MSRLRLFRMLSAHGQLQCYGSIGCDRVVALKYQVRAEDVSLYRVWAAPRTGARGFSYGKPVQGDSRSRLGIDCQSRRAEFECGSAAGDGLDDQWSAPGVGNRNGACSFTTISRRTQIKGRRSDDQRNRVCVAVEQLLPLKAVIGWISEQWAAGTLCEQ